MPILTLLFSLLSGLPGLIGDYFKKKQEIETIKLETQRQIAVAQQQMASDMAKAESETAIARLGVTSSYFKYFTFCMWFGPFISGVFLPHFAAGIFDNLKLMPDWYVQSCVMIMFAIWGIQVAAPVVASVFTNLTSYLNDPQRQGYKLQKAHLANDKAFYDKVRQGIFTQGMTDAQIQVMQDALAARDKDA